jgi:hypothetical protein
LGQGLCLKTIFSQQHLSFFPRSDQENYSFNQKLQKKSLVEFALEKQSFPNFFVEKIAKFLHKKKHWNLGV